MRINLPETLIEGDFPISRAERIEDYLDHLCGPLLSDVPARERNIFRAEAEHHLYALIAEYDASGLLTDEEATSTALREYGEPWQAGAAFLEAWQEQSSGGERGVRRDSRSYSALLSTFAFFGFGSVVTIGILQGNRILLKPNPVLWMIPMVLTVVLPIISGCAVGYRTRMRPARSVGIGMLPVLCHSLLTGWVMSPYEEFRILAVFQCLYWLPIGMACAMLASTLRQYRRRQTYLRRVLS